MLRPRHRPAGRAAMLLAGRRSRFCPPVIIALSEEQLDRAASILAELLLRSWEQDSDREAA